MAAELILCYWEMYAELRLMLLLINHLGILKVHLPPEHRVEDLQKQD